MPVSHSKDSRSRKKIIFERNKIDTKAIDDELLISVIEACEQSENEWRSENIRWGLKKRAANGTSGLYNRPCYGYKKDKHGMLIIDDEQAKVVRNIFNWYLEGYSIGGIIKKLETNGIKTPKGKDRWSKKGIEFTQLEMASRSNVEVLEDGTVCRKNKKYSSKRGKL